MDGIYQFGINMILALQNQAPWLIPLMAFFTNQVAELFYMVLFVAIYWCWNSVLGIRLGLLLLISQGLKGPLKMAFHQPRPFWVDSTVQAFNEETSFGIPSGHAMDATVIFGGIAAWINKTWAWILAVLIIFYIGISRVGIGVHFPTDVIAGWLVGAIILFVYLKVEKPAQNYLGTQSTRMQILWAALASVVMILLTLFAAAIFKSFTIPEFWQQNVFRAFPDLVKFDPFAVSGAYSYAGALFGLGLGAILMNKRGGFDAGGAWWKRLMRFFIGLVGLIVIYLGLDILLDVVGLGGYDLPGYLGRYVRYALVALWGIWLAPLVFFSLKLASPLKSSH